MKNQSDVDWVTIRAHAANFPDEAFKFIRDGLTHTVKMAHGKVPDGPVDPNDEGRHVSGQQLCLGLRDLAIQRYGMLARTVLSHWGIRTTGDFGTMVYALIDRGELRSSSRDTIEDFQNVFDFDESFAAPMLG
ncbi:MAG: hypothetical protein KF745_05875 [Phycisphaeraceae bacterium]|nr:hypothetical protein [Phycisphaeraceae bacterium]